MRPALSPSALQQRPALVNCLGAAAWRHPGSILCHASSSHRPAAASGAPPASAACAPPHGARSGVACAAGKSSLDKLQQSEDVGSPLADMQRKKVRLPSL
jgi:hypothetical protein